jgi:hypothetical protein
VLVADLGGNGKADIIATTDASTPQQGINVFLGDGNGTFQSAQAVNGGQNPDGLASGDFNGDGKLDLAVANLGSGPAVLLGNGDGSFQNASILGTTESPVAIAVGDLRGNGKLDIVTADTSPPAPAGSLIIRLGNGDGTFQPAVQIPVANGFLPHTGLVLADLNGDGKLDLAVTSGGDAVSVLLGNGDGTFQAAITFGTLEPTYALGVGDFNHDGKPDLVVNEFETGAVASNLPSGGFVEMFLGNGNGTFRSAGVTPTGSAGYALAVGDFNGDSNLDVALENTSQLATSTAVIPSVGVLLGNGDGTFQTLTSFEIGSSQVAVLSNQGLAAGDFTGTGKVSLAATDNTTKNVTVLLNQNLPAATMVTGIDSGTPAEVRGFDSTGKLLFRFLPYLPDFAGGVRVAQADFNGDGTPDIVTVSGPGIVTQVRIFDGVTGWQISGPLGNMEPYGPVWAGGAFVATGDVDGDGNHDLVTGADASGGPHVKVFDGTTGAVMQYVSRPDLTDGFFAYDPAFGGGVRVAVADVNGDGQQDIITGAGPSGGPHVHIYDGKTLAEIPLSNSPGFTEGFMAFAPSFQGGVYVAAADINGDGRADVIVSGNTPVGTPQVEVLGGADGSQLQAFNAYTPSGGDVRVIAGAIDSDGRDDIITAPGPGGNALVQVFDGTNPSTVILSFNPYGSGTDGIFVGAASAG